MVPPESPTPAELTRGSCTHVPYGGAMSIGAAELFFSLAFLLAVLVLVPTILYWVIRLAVRHALRDVPSARRVTDEDVTPTSAPTAD